MMTDDRPRVLLTPRTEAGRALLTEGCCEADYDGCVTDEPMFRAAILAIEREAAAPAATEALTEAGADAHSGWYLYEMERDGKSKHHTEWAFCTVAACAERYDESHG